MFYFTASREIKQNLMKRTLTSLLLPFFVLLFLSFDKDSLVDHPMPVLPGKTLDGKTIDTNYFKGRVTIVSFMYVNCPSCMTEIPTLNKVTYEYRSQPKVQVLCMARQTKQQMADFNGNSRTLFSKMRRAMKADSITYPILPACPDADSKIVQAKRDGNDSNRYVRMESECSIIEDTYGFTAFPTMFFVDKKGVIRKIKTGPPASKNDPDFYKEIKKEIDRLLAE